MSGLSRRKFLFGLAATGGALVLRRGLPYFRAGRTRSITRYLRPGESRRDLAQHAHLPLAGRGN